MSDVKRVWAEFIDTTGYDLTMHLVSALFKTVGLLAEFQMMSQPLQPASRSGCFEAYTAIRNSGRILAAID